MDFDNMTEDQFKKLSPADQLKAIAHFKAKTAEAESKAKAARTLTLKIGQSGGLSVYGLGRFPVTLYKEQWQKLLAMAKDINDFIAANGDKLKVKASA